MSDEALLLWSIPAAPLLGAILCALMGGSRLRVFSHLPCIVGASVSALLSLFVLLGLFGSEGVFNTGPPITWFRAGPVNVSFKLTADTLTAVMLFVITFIGTWIAVFSIGYMCGDAGYTRFFAIVSLFLFSMTLLVLADNLILLFFGWEGVGLCSYLLVGYWYAKPSAAAAARKAFLVTRLGDVCMLLGIFLLWSVAGHRLEFDFLSLKAPALIERGDGPWVALACLLLVGGAVGKSAQLPLYVWLPDAMEGPTPVSALIHAATMVTAGVYLLARCAPLFALFPEVQLVIAILGAATALIAAYIALTQTDLKRVLAYSTVSQLGYMFLALGTSGKVLPTIAVAAAIFHLFTHAFFKAVLFLSAGSVMHAMGGVIDMRRFGGLRKVLPVTHITFLCSAASLAALPLLSGFWSKDQILEVAFDASHGPYGSVYLVLFGIALLTALLTAFYTFRAYFLTFWGETKLPPEAGSHGHGDAHAHSEGHGHGATIREESVMNVPLIVLAIGALFVGGALGPTGIFYDFLAASPGLGWANREMKPPEHHTNWTLIVAGSVAGLIGVALAWWMFVRKPGSAEGFAKRAPKAYYLSLDRLYVDEIYAALFVRPLTVLASICRGIEALVFDLVRLIAAVPGGLAKHVLRPMQNGLVQFYGLSMVMGLAAFLFYLIVWAGR